MRHTKIIATLGPATTSDLSIRALVAAGVDVFRLNFSHGTHDEHAGRFRAVRTAAEAEGRHVAILQDLGGPKIRTGQNEGGRPIPLAPGDRLEIVVGDDPGRPGRVSTTYAPLASSVDKGDRLLLDDGKVEIEVESRDAGTIVTRVVSGSEIGEHKGINAPGVPLPAEAITDKDAADLEFGLTLGVDLVALSFVQSAGDIWKARQLAERAGRADVPLIAKLERPAAIRRLEEVMTAADAVMVARGDLGLELPLEHVPRVQKEVLRVGRTLGIPVIVATQVLESMRSDPRPTRAEVSDAAGAVDAGADAIMLSGETAVGRYPVRTVETLASIIVDAESMPPTWTVEPGTVPRVDHVQALCDAAVTLANHGQADAIVAITREGRTARLLSARRPRAGIHAASDREEVARRLALWRGVVPLVVSHDGTTDEVADRALAAIRDVDFTARSTVVFVNASPDLDRGQANFLRIRHR